MTYQTVGLNDIPAMTPAGQRDFDVQETRTSRARRHAEMADLAWARDAGPEASVKATRKHLQAGALGAHAGVSSERTNLNLQAGRDVMAGSDEATQVQRPATSQADITRSELSRLI